MNTAHPSTHSDSNSDSDCNSVAKPMQPSIRISAVRARRVWDSRGRPTVEAEVHLASGAWGRAIAPAGASTGSAEALELRDGGAAFGGMDVQRAVRNVQEVIAPCLVGLDDWQQEDLDRHLIHLDGTPNKQRLGANAVVATSLAALHARAACAGKPLWQWLAGERPLQQLRMPLPQIQIFGGGAHAAGRVDIQDFLVVCPAANSFAQALEWTAEIYRAAGALLKAAGKLTGVADEGGYWPNFSSNEAVLDTLMQAIEHAGLRPGTQVGIALDVAASSFGSQQQYRLSLEQRVLNSAELGEWLGGWLKHYPIVSVEDPLAEDDKTGFRSFTRAYGKHCQVVGDDFLVTSAARVNAALVEQSVNAVLIKPNQVGTVTETLAAVQAAKAAGMATIVSARSGESEDVSIAHLAVGWDAGQIKVGSFSRSERMAKWNECLRIEETLKTLTGTTPVFAGWQALGLNQGRAWQAEATLRQRGSEQAEPTNHVSAASV